MTDSPEPLDLEGNKSDVINRPGQYDAKLIEAVLRPVNNANEQIERVWRVYKYLVLSLGIVIATGLGVFYFLFANSVDSLTKQVQYRVDVELQKPNIQNIIHNEVLSRLSSEEVTSLVRQGTSEVQQVYRIFHLFNNLDDDINNYDELSSIAASSNYKFKDTQQFAKDMLKAFDNKMLNDGFIKYIDIRGTYSFAVFSQELGSDPSKWTLDDFNTKYSSIPEELHPYCIAYVWFQNNKFPILDRLQFLYRAIKEDKNPWAIYVASILMNREAKIDKAYLSERAEYIKWWDEHKVSYQESPK